MLKKLTAAIASLGIVAASVIGGAAAPASAIGIEDAFDLWNYVLTIKGTQLQSAMGPAANAAWSPQIAAQAAASASYSSVGQQFGVVDIDRMGEVIPLKQPVSPIGAGQKLGPIRLPAFPMQSFLKVTPASAGGALAAVTAFQFRGDIAGTSLGWLGVDANAAVCADQFFGQAGSFQNFLTGQDCSMYQMAQDFVPNLDAVGYTNQCTTYTGPVVAGTHIPGPTCGGGQQSYVIGTTPLSSAYWIKSVTGSSTVSVVLEYEPRPTATTFSTLAGSWVCFDASGNTLSAGSASVSFAPPSGIAAIAPGYTTTLNRNNTCSGQRMALLGPSRTIDGVTTYGWIWVFGSGLVASLPVDPDPERVLVCEVTASNTSVYSGNSEPFHESDGAYPRPNCPDVPAGTYPTHVRITAVGDGVSNVLYDEDVDPEYLDWQANEAARCADRDCVLDLVYLPTGLSCFGMGDQCNGWMQSPTRDTDYQCQYGGEPQPVQECFAYAQVFDPVKRLDGMPYADPKTGDELGTTTGLRYDQQLMGRPGQDPMMVRACGGSGTFSMNPLDFVLRPIQCALEWAFVPRPAIVNGYGNEVQGTLETRAPGQIVTIVSGWSITPVMTGCKIEFTHWSTGQVIPLVDACSGPMAAVATISRFVTAVSMVVLAAVLVRRQIAGVVDFKGN